MKHNVLDLQLKFRQKNKKRKKKTKRKSLPLYRSTLDATIWFSSLDFGPVHFSCDLVLLRFVYGGLVHESDSDLGLNGSDSFTVVAVNLCYVLLESWCGFHTSWKVTDEYSWGLCGSVLNVLHFRDFFCIWSWNLEFEKELGFVKGYAAVSGE